MDLYIEWPRPVSGRAISPFSLGPGARRLSITFHDSSLTVATPEQAEALSLLRELAFLPELDALATEPSDLPRLEIGFGEDGTRTIPIHVTAPGRRIEAAIVSPESWRRPAAALVNVTDLDSPIAKRAFQDLMVAMAHRELRRDLFITLAPHLLKARDKSIVRPINPRTPREAAKIVGLYLRTRDNYTYQADRCGHASYDRGLFYWVLARHRLPNMWKYFSACVAAEAIRGDDILYLGQSVLVRCVRALQARDAIGAQFYVPQNNSTRDETMYHFDYLTLLLGGALDAQARVAARAYRITKPAERYMSFRRCDVREALSGAGATQLCQLIADQSFLDLMTLLHQPRNTIHGAGLPTVALSGPRPTQESLVRVLPQHKDAIWEAAERCGSTARWGLRRQIDVGFEPYTYALTLVEDCMKQIDQIASVTDVTRLAPGLESGSALLVGPPTDRVFRQEVRDRLAILG